MLAKSARAQRGRRLRNIDPTSIHSLCAAIDQTGERPGEPEHTAPNQNEIENNLVHTHTLEHRVMLTLYMCAIETLPLYATACVLSLIGWRSVPTFSFGWMRALPSCYPPLMQVTGAQRPGRTRTHTHTHACTHAGQMVPDPGDCQGGPRPKAYNLPIPISPCF